MCDLELSYSHHMTPGRYVTVKAKYIQGEGRWLNPHQDSTYCAYCDDGIKDMPRDVMSSDSLDEADNESFVFVRSVVTQLCASLCMMAYTPAEEQCFTSALNKV